MAYTFGGATSDDISFNNAWASAIANGNQHLVAGWWFPTTLTATRGLWSVGAVHGAEIDTVTDELRLRTDNTTDGQWTTAGVDLAINNWYFLAFYVGLSNTNGATWRVWRGTIDSEPVEATVSVAVARSGNFTSAGTGFTLGNKGNTGSVAFQGNIENVVGIEGSGGVAAQSTFKVATLGLCTAAEAEVIRQEWVIPLWRGQLNRVLQSNPYPQSAWSMPLDTPLNASSAFVRRVVWAATPPTPHAPDGTAIGGATFSQARCPMPANQAYPPFLNGTGLPSRICCTGL